MFFILQIRRPPDLTRTDTFVPYSPLFRAYRPFYIVGEVKQPGSYPYVSGMSVINAIALAGGFTYRARESSFYLSRTGANGEKTKLDARSEEHTSELQSLMRISYAVFCLNTKPNHIIKKHKIQSINSK